MDEIDYLHNTVLEWGNENGYKRDLESFIVETYDPIDNGEEDVEIYLPVQLNIRIVICNSLSAI